MLQNHIFCLKLLKVTVESNVRNTEVYWVATSNYLPKGVGKWAEEVFLQEPCHQGLFRDAQPSDLVGLGLESLKECQEEERKLVFCINPLRYKMDDCSKTFDVIPSFEA